MVLHVSSYHFVLTTFHIVNKIQGGSNMTGTDCGLCTHKSVPVIFEPPCISYSIQPFFCCTYFNIELSVKRDLSYFLLAHEGNHVQQCILIFLVLQTPAIVLLILQTPSPNLSQVVDALGRICGNI